MKKVGAILLDTRSIQKYVFASNKLRTNAGASYLVDSIFSDLMEIHVLSSYRLPPVSWQEAPSIQLFGPHGNDYDCEVVYVGGGNMFILVNSQSDQSDDIIRARCREIVKTWSRQILLHAPGLKTGAAIDVLELQETTEEGLSRELNKLLSEQMYKQLKENQNIVLPQVNPAYTGLTLECDISGNTANVPYDLAGEHRWISSEAAAKLNAFSFASEALQKKYADLLQMADGTQFEFASDFNRLGYKEGESYICVIHIDGNNMGIKFSSCDGIQERKDLSLKVASIVENGFRKLLSTIVAEYSSYAAYLDMEQLYDDQEETYILPIRPIIIGGDDVTFVCPGRLGILYAQRFIQEVNRYTMLEDEQYICMCEKNPGVSMSQKMSCCGGIAIVPAKYPFFRAYELAEQLCSTAKAKSRQHDNSLIDFAILHGDMYSSIDTLRRDQYEGIEGGLHYGPYSLIEKTSDQSHITDLFALMEALADVPENKVKKLREVLTQDKHAIIRFLELSEDVQHILLRESPHAASLADAFWQKKDGEETAKTRYIDAIEIMDFMPEKRADRRSVDETL